MCIFGDMLLHITLTKECTDQILNLTLNIALNTCSTSTHTTCSQNELSQTGR